MTWRVPDTIIVPAFQKYSLLLFVLLGAQLGGVLMGGLPTIGFVKFHSHGGAAPALKHTSQALREKVRYQLKISVDNPSTL